jgi:hypothetical protein
MIKIFDGWYNDTHLGERKITGTDIVEMNQIAFDVFRDIAEKIGHTDIEDNIHIDYREVDPYSYDDDLVEEA